MIGGMTSSALFRRAALAALLALSPITGTAVATARPAPAGPGDIVESRPLTPAELIPGAARGFRIVYRTTGQNGEPAISGGDLFLPAGAAPPGGRPVVSWAHSTSGTTRGCTPNLDGQRADGFDETPQLSAYLARGYAVEATDYIGLGADGVYEYLAGRAAGHAVLDIVRAGRTSDPGLSESVVLAGHSIGGQSVLFAAASAPDYAPDLDVRGVLSYAPTSNVDGVIAAVAGPELPAAPALDGLQVRILMILAGLDHARPELHVLDHLSPWGRQMLAVAEAGRDCMGAIEAAVAGQPLGRLYAEPLSDPAIGAALRDYLGVPTTGYRAPVLLLQGVPDTVQPMPTTLLLQEQLRQGGADSRLRLYPSATHFTVLPQAADDDRAFLLGVLPNR